MAYVKSLADVLGVFKENKIIIYGAGYVACNFYFALKTRNLEKQVKYFMVSQEGKGKRDIQGIEIRTINDIEMDDNTIICVAVHETNRKEIEYQLQKRGVENYIWIYPYLLEMMLGEPVKQNIDVSVRDIIRYQNEDNYCLAVRYLAIENYFGKNDCGYDIYLKSMELQCGKKTAVKRLHSFKKLIEDWKQNGYKQGNPIFIDKEFKIIDGLHRLTLANYFHNNDICCNIFNVSSYYGQIIKPEVGLPKDILRESIFSLQYIELLEKTQKMIFG